MKVIVKKLVDWAEIPKRHTSLASGFDLEACIPEDVFIHPGEHKKIPTGLAFEIPAGHEGQVRPRSGLSLKHGVMAAFGTIDADYRGEVSVVLYNHSFRNFRVEPKMRIAQMVISPVSYCELEESSTLSDTTRGEAGFGSTGLKDNSTFEVKS